MRESCVHAVENVLGRPLERGEERGIDGRIHLAMVLEARRDPAAWRSLSGTQRLQLAAKRAARELISELSKQKQRVSLMVPVFDRIEQTLERAGSAPAERLKALSRLLAWDPGAKDGAPMSLESSAIAQQKLALGQMRKVLLASNPKFMGLVEDRTGIRDLMREIYGEDTGNVVAREAAKAWKSALDEMRDRYNAAGGDIGKLGEHYFPQHHEPLRVAQAGRDGWIDSIMPKLDRDKYLNVDGSRMSDGELKDFLTHAYDTIINDGKPTYEDLRAQPDMLNKDVFSRPAVGYGLYADRHSQHRQIFFKDADSFLAYQERYGGKSLYSMMESHVARLARDTAVLERFGPYADRAFAYFNEREARSARDQATREPNSGKAVKRINKAEGFNLALYNAVTGRNRDTPTAASDFLQGARNVLTGLRLGKVVITALGDEAGMYSTAWANGIPYTRVMLREAQLVTGRQARGRLQGLGLGLNSMLGSLNRFGGELYGGGWTARFATFVMRITGAEALWDIRAQAIGAELMYHVGELTRQVADVKDLADHDEAGVLPRKGITQSVWQTWRRAELDDDGRVTPETIYRLPDEQLADLGANPEALRREAATALMAHVHEEAGMGVMQTGARERTKTGSVLGGVFGTSGGRTALLFKSFAISMMLKHWARAASMGTLGAKAGYLARIATYGTLIAAAGNIVRNLLAGQNTPNLNPTQADGLKGWGQAVLRGGGLGYFGDYLWDAENSHDNSFLESLAGPVYTLGSDIWNVTGAAALKAQKGERTDEGANLIRFARDNTPFANLWYTQALFDHLLWNSMQEAANPGYLDRLEEKQARYGRSYWWHPDEALPSEAPDLGHALGQPQP